MPTFSSLVHSARQFGAGLAKFSEDVLSAVHDADHEESSPHSEHSVVSSYRSSVACALDGGSTTEPQGLQELTEHSDEWEEGASEEEEEEEQNVAQSAAEDVRFAFLDFRSFQFGVSLSKKDRMQLALMTFRFCQSLTISRSVPHSMLVMCVVRMLAQCQFAIEDIEQTLAVALCNLEKVSRMLEKMSTEERTMVAVVQLFLAHSFLSDEVVPLKAWHSMFFEEYCDLVTLEDAVVKLWRQNDYKIMVADDARETVVERLRERVPE